MNTDSETTDDQHQLSVASDLPLVPSSNDVVPNSVYEGLGVVYSAERFVAGLIRAVIFIGMLGLGLIVGAQIFFRYVLAAPILGIEELAPLFALWAYFGGMVYATRQRKHVVGGILRLVVTNVRLTLFFRLISSLLCIATTVILLYFAWDIFMYNVSLGRESAYMRWPWALWGSSMLSGFSLMVIYFSLQLCLETRAFINHARLP